MGDFRIVFDEDGYPRELRTAAERERAIARGVLTRETDIVVYRDDEPAYACKAGSLPELWGDEPPPQPESEDAGSPAPSPPQRAPTPSPAPPPPPAPPPTRSKPSLWASISPPKVPATTSNRAPQTILKPVPQPRPAPAPKQKVGCVTVLFWAFVIYVLAMAFG